jgi:hypothetical protein
VALFCTLFAPASVFFIEKQKRRRWPLWQELHRLAYRYLVSLGLAREDAEDLPPGDLLPVFNVI